MYQFNPQVETSDDPTHAAFARNVIEYLNPSSGDYILNLGCGNGLVTFAAAEALGSEGMAIGVDMSKQMIEQAEKKSKELGCKNVQLHCNSITELDDIREIQGKQFDAIICTSALVVLESPLQAIRSWTKYLRPGGLFIASVNHPNNFIAGLVLEIASARVGVKGPMSRLWIQNEHTLTQLLEACNLKVEDVQVKEQMGFGTRYFSVSDGEEQWNKFHNSDLTKAFRETAGDEQARAYFLEDWKLFAGTNGQIEECDGVYLVKAKKKSDKLEPLPSQGSCACGYAKWEAAVLPISVCQCCCRPCRKVSGAPFLMMMEIPTWAVIFTPSLQSMGNVSLMPQARWTFCPKCGSIWTFQAFRCMENIEIAMATLEDDKLHGISSKDVLSKADKKWCWTISKVDWWDIPDDGWRREERIQSESKTVVY